MNVINKTEKKRMDRIVKDNEEFLDSEKRDKQYYIGLYKIIQNEIVFCSSVANEVFLKYSVKCIEKYLKQASILYVKEPKVDIIQLIIQNDETYTANIKTYWIRIIQRHWKNRMKERKEMIAKMCAMSNLNYSMTYGKRPVGLQRLPTIEGMLSQYAK